MNGAEYLVDKVGYLKVLNSGEYFEIIQKKKQQGFCLYEHSGLTSKYLEFQSIFTTVIDFSTFEHFYFHPSYSFANEQGYIEKKMIHEEFYKYANKGAFITNLQIGEAYNLKYYTGGGVRGVLNVGCEIIVNNQVFDVTIQTLPYGDEENMEFNDMFTEAQLIWELLQKVQDKLSRGYWIPIVLPNINELESSKKHMEWVQKPKGWNKTIRKSDKNNQKANKSKMSLKLQKEIEEISKLIRQY